MATVNLKGVKKSYGEVEVIRDLYLEIKEKEFVVLVGPSGCGKSTTLRMIAGLEDISGGDLYIGDNRVNDYPPGDRDVAMVFQDYALYPHMTVYENMAFSMRLKHRSQEEIDERVGEAAKMLDLVDYLQRKPANLSGGQRQRVAMGRAIVKQSDVFLFDEPLSNLDAKLRSQMRIEIKRFHLNTQVTTVYVTHDQLEAMTLADRLVIMNEGDIEQMGTPIEVYEKPRTVFVATFIGSPEMNLINVKVEKRDGSFFAVEESGCFTFKLPDSKNSHVSDGMSLIMGIRPSDIFISSEIDQISEDWKVDGLVDMVELLGKNAFLTLKIGSIDVVGEIMGRTFPQIGERTKLSFNLNHIHLFDTKTKINLQYQ